MQYSSNLNPGRSSIKQALYGESEFWLQMCIREAVQKLGKLVTSAKKGKNPKNCCVYVLRCGGWEGLV